MPKSKSQGKKKSNNIGAELNWNWLILLWSNGRIGSLVGVILANDPKFKGSNLVSTGTGRKKRN
jgi:hypothetical protein